ncbi:hypothetical protein B5G50_28350 [Brevibacillus brevis]|nr:hypothetical protein B5G50_28350 [Brevibacillus brevis]
MNLKFHPSLRRLSKVLGVSVAFLDCFEKLLESTLGERIIKARLFYEYTKKEFVALLEISERTRPFSHFKRAFFI